MESKLKFTTFKMINPLKSKEDLEKMIKFIFV